MLVPLCLLLLAIGAIGHLNADEDLIVQLPKGKIRGHVLQSETNKPYYGFQEIPYAAPPIGSNRFQLPKEPEPWSGVLDTTNNTKVCFQGKGKYTNLERSEDCLYLNVYTPVKPGSPERLPVLFWIHGGAFQIGSGAYIHYGPKYIMDHGIVVVTINYRLGPFGLLTTVDDVIPANIGLKDQLFALEWVQENIELFGGNKSSVTIDGQSAGSGAVDMHLMGRWPNNKVLFHAAIMQSGSGVFSGRRNNARQEAFAAGKKIDQTFNSSDSKELLKLLQKAPAESILSAAKGGMIIENEGPFSCQIYDCLERGLFKKVPVIIGFNSEEGITQVSQKGYQERAAALDKDPSLMISAQFNISYANKTAAGTLLRRIYTNTSFQADTGAYVRWSSDSFMNTPVIKQALLQSKYAFVYLYEFAYKGPLGGSMDTPYVEGAERVRHGEDLTYFWDRQQNSDLSKFPAEDALMLHRYVTLWTNFVKYHNPTPVKDPLLREIVWPRIDFDHREYIPYLNLNKTLDTFLNPRYFQKVNKVYDYFITPEDIL